MASKTVLLPTPFGPERTLMPEEKDSSVSRWDLMFLRCIERICIYSPQTSFHHEGTKFWKKFKKVYLRKASGLIILYFTRFSSCPSCLRGANKQYLRVLRDFVYSPQTSFHH